MIRTTLAKSLLTLVLVSGAATLPALAQDAAPINFGDDASHWSNDGQCDDARFAGAGMSAQPTLGEILHDATDCRAAYEGGTITLAIDAPEVAPAAGDETGSDTATAIDFGSDAGGYANDGECDDARFTGEGMATEPTRAEIMRDATDCRTAFEAGRVTLLPDGEAAVSVPDEPLPEAVEADPATRPEAESIDFGDNDSAWSKNGSCDDPRFEGPGMAGVLNDDDTLHDAADCRKAYVEGTISLKTETGPAEIDFGDDTGPYPDDNECDDPRFTGTGMARNIDTENVRRDATDCRAHFDAGTITYQGETVEAFDFGSDASFWANDGECDDLRFTGPGTDKKLLADDMMGDATDCRALLEAGQVEIRLVYTPEYAAGAPYDAAASGIDFGDNTSSYANDNECDDPRFEGPGAAGGSSDSHILADANDCRTNYEAGTITLVGAGLEGE